MFNNFEEPTGTISAKDGFFIASVSNQYDSAALKTALRATPGCTFNEEKSNDFGRIFLKEESRQELLNIAGKQIEVALPATAENVLALSATKLKWLNDAAVIALDALAPMALVGIALVGIAKTKTE